MSGNAQFGPLRVSWSGDAAEPAFESIFGRHVRAHDPGGTTDILVRVERVRRPVEAPEGPRQFHFGAMSGWVLPSAVVLADGRSEIRITNGGRDIVMRAYPRGDEGDDPEWVDTLPAALAIAARSHGVFHLHAAHVVLDGRSLIVVGDTCSGKSTTAVGLCELGAWWGGDDLALVARDGSGHVMLWSVPRWFHLRPATAARFPRVAAHAAGRVRQDGRVDVDPDLAWPGRRVPGPRRPDVIVLPSIADQATSLVRSVEVADAMGELLAASAMIVIPGGAGTSEQFALLSEMLGSAQGVSLTLGRDGLEDPLEPARALRRYLDHE